MRTKKARKKYIPKPKLPTIVDGKLLVVHYLRAIAAILVVLRHTFADVHLSFYNLLHNPFWFGDAGVDIFFVISGFIMCYILPRENEPLLFLKRRIIRIYPTYWLVYLFSALAWIFTNKFLGVQLAPHGNWFGNLSLLPFELEKNGDNSHMVLGIAWTLYYEIFFYCVIAAILYFFKSPRVGVHCFAAVIWLMLCINNLLMGLDIHLFLEFIVGFLVADSFFGKKISPERAGQNFGIIFICIFILYIREIRESAWLVTTLTVLILSCGVKVKIPRIKFLDSVGDYSYSLYLIHMPLLGMGSMLCKAYFSEFAVIFVGAWIILIFTTAWLVHVLFEKPIVKKLNLRLHGDLVQKIIKPNRLKTFINN